VRLLGRVESNMNWHMCRGGEGGRGSKEDCSAVSAQYDWTPGEATGSFAGYGFDQDAEDGTAAGHTTSTRHARQSEAPGMC
jgi:hypothetical protein